MKRQRQYHKFLVFFLFIFAVGCASQIASVSDFTKGWIGQNISELIAMQEKSTTYASKIEWKQLKYDLKNGNSIYVDPIRRDCYIHWEVNSQGMIIGYKIVGERCF